LYESEQTFCEAIDRCAEIMDADLGTPLHEVLFGISSATLLGNTRYAQPGLFAIEYALAHLLRHWGVEPDFVIGHSVGEIAAACVAGLLDLEDAARFVVARGRLMGSLPAGGKMLAVDGTLEQAEEWIAGKEADVSIATVNGPNAIVISGKGETIDEVAEIAKAAGRRTRQLDVSHAFHSPLMDPILGELGDVARTMRALPPRVPLVSNLTGDFVEDIDIGETYWSDHVRQAVRFHEGMSALIDARATVLIEIGPRPTLTPAIASSFDLGKIRSVTTLRRGQDDLAQVLETLGSLHVEGVPVNLDRLFWSPSYRRVPLPLYPFRRDRHWLRGDRVLDLTEPTGESTEKPLAIKEDLHPLLGKVASVGPRRVVFETTLTASQPWTDHRVLGMTIFPGMAYLEMAARGFAAATGQDWRAVVLKDVVFERPIVLAYRKKKQISLSLDGVMADGSGEATFAILGAGENGRERYCRGKIVAASAETERVSLATDLDPIKDSSLEIGPFYGGLREAGLEYGATFATVRELWLGKPESGVAIGRVMASQVDETAGETPYSNAVLLDGCLQVFGAALQSPEGVSFRGAFVPATIQAITLRRPLPGQVWSHVSVNTNADGRAALAAVRVLTDDGELIAEIDSLELRRTASLAPSADGAAQAEEVVILRGESRDKLLEQLREVRQHERIGVVAKWLANEVKDTMGQSAEALDFDNLDPSTAFLEIGLDSLLVTELQRRIQEKLGFRFQPMQGLDYQSIESLAGFILDDVLAAGVAANGAVKEAEPVAVTAH
jgi:acyl transferase domain-containing protein